MQPPTDRLQTVREIASAQVRLAKALASALREQEPWRRALREEARGGGKKARLAQLLRRGKARPAHAELADQLAHLQRCAGELRLWADRAQAERRAAAGERERMEAEAIHGLEAAAASGAQVAEERRRLEALHAEMDGLPTRLHAKYAALEKKARVLQQAIAAADLKHDRLSEAVEAARAGSRAGKEVEAALERAEQTLRRLEQVAGQAADQLHQALGAHAAEAGARGLAESLVAAVKAADPAEVEALAQETFRFLSERADAARAR
jgi:hypothetical protein